MAPPAGEVLISMLDKKDAKNAHTRPTQGLRDSETHLTQV